jgi:hypothetical protein
LVKVLLYLVVMVVRMLVKPISSVRCVSSKEVSNSTGDGSMRDGVNVDDRKVLICFQLVFTKHPTTVFHIIALCWEF